MPDEPTIWVTKDHLHIAIGDFAVGVSVIEVLRALSDAGRLSEEGASVATWRERVKRALVGLGCPSGLPHVLDEATDEQILQVLERVMSEHRAAARLREKRSLGPCPTGIVRAFTSSDGKTKRWIDG